MVPQDATPIKDNVLSPNWDMADGWSESWLEQIPGDLRTVWNDLSLQAKLVAVIVGAEGIRTRDIE